ncbi:MAG TPA: DUF4397 domain-containing protein [Actinocrinis sp.]|nr:DUF4397 domain-containing protein [Actinocrinis sp.]
MPDSSRIARRTGRRSSRVLAAAAALTLVFAAQLSGSAASAASGTGWIRLAHLSPNTPAVDVYLYPFGGHTAQLVLTHVSYGTASPYQAVTPGIYTVAMRAAGASASTNPVISTNVTVKSGGAYTVAGLGTFSALTLDVLTDQVQAPVGKAGVRLIEASLANPTVSVSGAQGDLATDLRFPKVTDYESVAPGAWSITLKTPTTSTDSQVELAAASSHTLVVLDSSAGGLKVLDLTDATGVTVAPTGGVQTGLGGTAPHPVSVAAPIAPPSLPDVDGLWGAVLLVGLGTTVYAVRGWRRSGDPR